MKFHTRNPYLLLDGSLALGNLWLDCLLLLDSLLLELQQLLDMYGLGHDSLPYNNIKSVRQVLARAPCLYRFCSEKIKF